MIDATGFLYNGKDCSEYGLKIAELDSKNTRETNAMTYTASLAKAPLSNRFLLNEIKLDDAPNSEFSVFSESPITELTERAILSWLFGGFRTFKSIKFYGGIHANITYQCVFTSAKGIYVNGVLHGFRLTAQFDSPFGRSDSTVTTVGSGTHTVSIVTTEGADGYVYPIVQFTGSSIDIVNTSDDATRHFTFSGLQENETVTVDNEIGYISSTYPGEKLSFFTSKKWLRLRRATTNVLSIRSVGDVVITCPRYVFGLV